MISSLLHRSNSNSYTDVPSAELGDTSASSRSNSKRRNNKDSNRTAVLGQSNNGGGWSILSIAGMCMVLLLVGILITQKIHNHDTEQKLQRAEELGLDSTTAFDDIPMPSGVNFGSWLSLEDYFFAGHAAVEVATPGFGEYQVAACLPPLHVGQQTGPKWYSETDLLGNMSAISMAHAVQVFQAHRTSFIDLEVDLERLATLGVKNIRVPMSWCLTEHDPRKVNLKHMKEADVMDKFTCEDPFFGKEVRWPAIPKILVEDFLRACNRHGVRAALDIHTYPGGTSIGTFSGVWPRWPKFWTEGDVQSTNFGAKQNPGHVVFGQFVEWMESLSESDPEAFAGLRGLSPMNEPAHLAGMFGGHNISEKNFLPPLPPDLADEYLRKLRKSSTDDDSTVSYSVPDGTHLRVFWWFQGAIDIFRKSKLPNLGKELHANIHESILSADCYTSRDEARAAREAIAIIASWWCSANTTTPEERERWSILDMHHYHSWSSHCTGTVDGQDSGYACGDEKTRDQVLTNCTRWAKDFRDIVDTACGEGAKLMSAEFSASSHHSVRKSCNSVSNLRESYLKQVNAAEEAEVELFYWSYHMPYGGAFRRAWSFQHLMYLFGIIDQPDEPQFECNDHHPDAQEPNDDVWQD